MATREIKRQSIFGSRLSESKWSLHSTIQYEFIVANGNVRMIDYVLRMDALKTEFQPLMDAYGINATLPTRRMNVAQNETTELTVKDIGTKTDNMLVQIYEHDFDLLIGDHQ
jgi:hypothetical protein